MNKEMVESEVDDNTFAKEALQCEIGVTLKKAREDKGLSVEYIIKELKFSKTFLEALESGSWENLPGEVYALGFLKQYAALLQVDVSSEMGRIKSKSFELKAPVVYRDVPISPHRKWTYVAITIFLLLVALNFSNTDDETQLQINTSLDDTTHETATHDTLEMPSLSESMTDTYTNEQLELQKIEPQPVEEVFIEKRTYSFYAATNDVWLQVSELDENAEPKLLREVLLKKGQSFSIIDTPAKLVLTAGNARALEVLEGNEVLFAAGSLGEENKVLKLFPINP
ncbi:MAG TPA: helix-turn-helix domain-containing protein [Ghiorsea sp.]|nr:helix-turn-helix domain-containing protein [Ghiorsea sp.]HIP06703.1 helix-turn-helix domain-containing protein [Mariprofundaceae bacterium]